MPTITIPAASVQYVPSGDERGGIYVNATNGRSITATIKLEDGTERTVKIGRCVIQAPTNQNTLLAAPDKANKAQQSGEVASLAAKVDALATQFSALMAALQPAPATGKRSK